MLKVYYVKSSLALSTWHTMYLLYLCLSMKINTFYLFLVFIRNFFHVGIYKSFICLLCLGNTSSFFSVDAYVHLILMFKCRIPCHKWDLGCASKMEVGLWPCTLDIVIWLFRLNLDLEVVEFWWLSFIFWMYQIVLP